MERNIVGYGGYEMTDKMFEEGDEAGWYSISRLCQNCMWAEGSGQLDKCTEYHMPLYMVKRKFKCKCFTDWEDRYR